MARAGTPHDMDRVPRILDALTRGPRTRRELCTLMGEVKRTDMALWNLRRRGTITRVQDDDGVWRWAIKHDSDAPAYNPRSTGAALQAVWHQVTCPQ